MINLAQNVHMYVYVCNRNQNYKLLFRREFYVIIIYLTILKN